MRCSWLVAVAVVLASGVAVAAQGPVYSLGRPPTEAELNPPAAHRGRAASFCAACLELHQPDDAARSAARACRYAAFQQQCLDRRGAALLSDPGRGVRLTAYLLHRSGIIAEDEVMDQTTLPQVVMPNRDSYAPPPFEKWKPGIRKQYAK